MSGDEAEAPPARPPRRMQQLLGDRAGDSEGTLLPELFLQRLPGNVRMVLASADETISLENLAALADKIAEVSSPAISGIAKPKVTSEVVELRAEVTKLQEAIKSLFSLQTTIPLVLFILPSLAQPSSLMFSGKCHPLVVSPAVRGPRSEVQTTL